MKVIIHYFSFSKSETIENVHSVDVSAGENCVLINMEDGKWKLIDLDKGKINVTVAK